jgi:hypothetical protein
MQIMWCFLYPNFEHSYIRVLKISVCFTDKNFKISSIRLIDVYLLQHRILRIALFCTISISCILYAGNINNTDEE